MNQRQLFLDHVAQTSDSPVMLEVEKANGVYIYDIEGKRYIDLVAGVSVSNVGHCHPKVVDAIKTQAEKYMHVMVYGEYIESPQVQFATAITNLLPETLNSVFFVTSGAEANEGAMKLAKRVNGRAEIIAFKNAYHGSTHGALSILGDEYYKQAFRPLLPDIRFINFNEFSDLNQITEKTSCVFIEPIQGEGGIILPAQGYLKALRQKCNETGTLLVFDEVQTGFGRTGYLFSFMKYNVLPDIITVAKGIGGGMPLGAFISSNRMMNLFTFNPTLGHINTFGGHPVCCAAALASLKVLIEDHVIETVEAKGQLFKNLLKHPKIKVIRGTGLFMAVQLENNQQILDFIRIARKNGVLTDWFLFAPDAFRIAPPLTITTEEIEEACRLILLSLNEL
jgi:acetylornithine/N-succinyldiaminopimelate aminotransferase